MKSTQFAVVALLCLASSSPAQVPAALDLSPPLWQSFTNLRTIRAVQSSPDGIWAATSGGVLLWRQQEQAFRSLTNTDGLSQNDARAVGFDQRGRVWIGLSNGLINVYDPERNTFQLIKEFREAGAVIMGFTAVGDSMYLATSVGVSLYLISRNEVKETYRNLGSGIQSDTVRSIFVDGRDLWAATSKGIARASLNLPNLQAPESWHNYTVAHGLPSNQVMGFAKYQNRMVAVLSNGIAQLEGETWRDLSGNLRNFIFRQAQSTTFQGTETLLAATANGLYAAAAPGSWQRVGADIPQITGMTVDARGVPWVATGNTGLFEYEAASGTWLLREPDGPATNNITSIALDQSGNVWCTSGFSDLGVAFMVYDGQRWYKYSSADDPAIFNDARRVTVLRNGERWIGTWGGGITVVTGEPGDLQFSRIDHRNSSLTGIATDANYVVVPFLKQDEVGNIWICNYATSNNNPLAVRTAEGIWRSFSSSFLQISGNAVTLEVEKTISTDRIWVGTNIEPASGSPGVSVLDHAGTPAAPDDDVLGGTLKQEDGLRSVNIRALAQDRDGFMWIGTGEGLYYWFAGNLAERICSLINGELSCVISENILCLGVDPANNKWIGTGAGISVLSGNDNISFSSITVDNSPLVSSVITGFAFNPDNGEVWIATTNGISRLRTPFTAPKQNLSALTGYPNPLRLGGEGGRFVITNLAANSAVKIYDAAGRLIKSFPREAVPGAQVIWDGTDGEGKLVPSGVYIFVAFIEETGASAAGKVVVIRR